MRPLTDEEKKLDAIYEKWLIFDKEKEEYIVDPKAPREAFEAYEKSKELYEKYTLFEF